MDEHLLAAYRTTDYRVRLRRGGWAAIQIGDSLPPALAALAGERHWGFITAWNPRSEAHPRALNRQAQRELLAALRDLPETISIRVGVGVGQHWHEASLFAVGPEAEALDALARHFGQNAYVHGQGAHGEAALRLMDKPDGHCGQSPG